MFAVLVFCLIGTAVAQRPVPCTTPPQWEASIYDTNEQQRFGLEGRLTYDAIYHRERIIDEVQEGTEDEYFDNIALFDLKVEFSYNFKTSVFALMILHMVKLTLAPLLFREQVH
jgi:hypothetical protein